MELKIQIAYSDLVALISQLPAEQFLQLKSDLSSGHIQQAVEKATVKEKLHQLLLNGPVMTDEHYEQYLETRKWINQWKNKTI